MSCTINAPDVISEMIDGEIIVVHLATGSYYNLEGAGAEIWDALMRGRSRDSIVATLAKRYDAPQADIAGFVDQLLAELRAEELVVETDDVEESSDPDPFEAAPDRLEPFVPPALTKFTDMQDIILLDPVHQVDERGWPNAAADVDSRAAG